MNVIYHYAAGPDFEQRLKGLATEGINVVVCPESDDERFFLLLEKADVLWHCLRPVDAEVFAKAPQLKLVQKIGVGVNTIDLDVAKSRGIAVCNMPGTNSRAVAELTLGLMLAVFRQIRWFDEDVRMNRGWRWPAARQDRLREIHGSTVGLVGMGAVPRILAPHLAAMGARVIYNARTPKPELPYAFRTLDDLLATSDIVSLHVPLTDATQTMIDERRLALMRPGSVLINTSRGGLVDEPALIAALDTGHLAGAGLDVFAEEPTPETHPLFGHSDVALTPHIAWLTSETLERSLEVALENCHRLENGQPLLHRVV
jgi:phosphoglycerate dehydrogenase-like enzyme